MKLMFTMKLRTALLTGLTVILFAACDGQVVYDENKKVDSEKWDMNDKLFYEVDIRDTAARYKVAVNVRNSTDYPYSNVYFFMNTILPDGSLTRRDTIECYLAYPDGTWKGKGSSNIKDNRFWIAKNVRFEQKGRYVFELYQATSDTLLKGIMDVGLHIEYQN